LVIYCGNCEKSDDIAGAQAMEAKEQCGEPSERFLVLFCTSSKANCKKKDGHQ
jgi:hypothetical protein